MHFITITVLEWVREEDNPTVVMAGTVGKVLRALLRDLLPLGFAPSLKPKKKTE